MNLYFRQTLICIVSCLVLSACGGTQPVSLKSSDTSVPLRVAISPYQELAMMVNVKDLGLEKKYQTKIDLVTMPWEDVLTALASTGPTIDAGFASLTDYMVKAEKLNAGSDDPVLFVYPVMLFKGSGFISFNPEVPELNSQTLKDSAKVKKFLSYRFGAQKNTLSQILLYNLAHKAGIKPSTLNISDISISDGILATENGSLDAAFAGGTQRTEALKRGGRVVLDLESAGFADIDGIACRKSTLERRRHDIESLIRMWFDCAKYVTSDYDHHTKATFAYLKANASTQYTLPEYKRQMAREFFPLSVSENVKDIIADNAPYSFNRIAREVARCLVENGSSKTLPEIPSPIVVEQSN